MKIRIGAVEKTFAALLLAYVALNLFPISAFLTFLVAIVMLVFGGWAFVRVSSVVVRRLLWRLRNRLIVAYLLIALVPVVLITALVGLGASLAGGQFAIYMVMADMERRLAELRHTTEILVQTNITPQGDWTATIGAHLREQFPGVELIFDQQRSWTWPETTRLQSVPQSWAPGSGLVLRDGLLFGWAQSSAGGRKVTAVFPVTREYLGQLAPDICESSILDLSTGRVLLHPSLPDSGVSHNRLPPAVRFADFEIRWGAPLPVHRWEDPRQVTSEWLTVRTRPSALLRTVFHQRVSWASEFIPMLFFSVAIAFLIAELIALIVGVSITRTITAAVHDLYQGTLRVRAGDFSHRIPIHGSDQLAELGVSFNQMTQNIERLLASEKEKERLQAELAIAREVQNQLYPRTMPDIESLTLTAACNPARMVSGDYYDYQQLGDDRVALAIGDVAGKGISAALLMATVQSSFRSQIRGSLEMAVSAGRQTTRVHVSTSSLVTHLNKQLFADTAPEKYATFYLGLYDEGSSTLTYTNAGHLPPILVRQGQASRLDVNGMVVGAFPFAMYGESQMELQSGDLLVFFTDGITEPENAYGEMFGEDQLLDVVIRNAHRPEHEIVTCVMEAVREWTGSDELQDDMTLLLVRRR